jgi:2-C-methyl-D-erythritol 2,4-cyclodiphosphate synthase
MSEYRIGYGEDIHRLVEGRPLVLSGVKIPYEKGLLGHSDADVVYHAVSDALLGALALGDIGHHFPTNDPRYDNCDSSIIVSGCYTMIEEKGFEVVNVDVSVAAEKPHLQKYLLDMRANLAKLLRVSLDRVSIKAMTNEGLDAVGEGKAIRANASVLLKEKA